MGFNLLNDHYMRNAPITIFDDIGIHHNVEVALPANYIKNPCSCGTIHKWEDKSFDVVEKELWIGLLPKKLKECKKCKDILTLNLYEEKTDGI